MHATNGINREPGRSARAEPAPGANLANADDQLIRMREVLALTGNKSRVTIWRRIRDGEFPKPVIIGKNGIAWFRGEIRRYNESRPRRVYRTEDVHAKAP